MGSRSAFMRLISGSMSPILRIPSSRCFVFSSNATDLEVFESSQIISESMDDFLGRIQLKQKLKSDQFVKDVFKRKNEDERRRSRQEKNRELTMQAYSGKPSNLSVKTESAKRFEENDIGEIGKLLQNALSEGKEIPTGMLLKYSSFLSRFGLVEEVQICRQIAERHNERFFVENIQLSHFLASALWHAGEHQKSVELFGKIFSDYPGHRKKIMDIFRFSILKAVASYPCPEQMELIFGFVGDCYKLNESGPALNLWQALFEMDVPSAVTEAHNLTEKYPYLRRYILRKFGSILQRARENESSPVLFRMIPLIRDLKPSENDAKHYTGCVYDALMDIYCKNFDIEGAKAVFQMAMEDPIKNCLWPETRKKLMLVVAFHEKKTTKIVAEKTPSDLPVAKSSTFILKF